MRADHQHLPGGVVDQAADGHDRGMAFLETLRRRFEVQVVLLQDFAQFAQVLDDQVRFRGPQLVQAIISRQHCAGTDTPVPRRFNIMLHVANKNGFVGRQAIFFQQLGDLGPFVPHVR